ncbi:hemerythrin domain-containing protein [Pyrobaculum sp.]|uniref:hemerythrin domain-containing protein n=1 Tax=Pyrobaculum sp. TaxID=2004705 RepID=UPI003D13CA68
MPFQGANRSGFPFTGGSIYVMVSEHGVAGMMEELHRAWREGDRSVLAELVDYAKLYIEHLVQHIDKENNVLFPMLESTAAEVPASKSVEEIERENEHDKWIAVLEELKKKYGV